VIRILEESWTDFIRRSPQWLQEIDDLLP